MTFNCSFYVQQLLVVETISVTTSMPEIYGISVNIITILLETSPNIDLNICYSRCEVVGFDVT